MESPAAGAARPCVALYDQLDVDHDATGRYHRGVVKRIERTPSPRFIVHYEDGAVGLLHPDLHRWHLTRYPELPPTQSPCCVAAAAARRDVRLAAQPRSPPSVAAVDWGGGCTREWQGGWDKDAWDPAARYTQRKSC